MKNLFSFLLFAFCISALQAQTNVSGGIYTNTTWTLANSPYIVVDTVVVFPGVTLTIEPGVVVKFDNGMRLEIRQSQIIAIGTGTDSITFTSNSAAPFAGIWNEIWDNGGTPSSYFHFCNFRYAGNGVRNQPPVTSAFIENSNFSYNTTGVFSISNSGPDNFVNYSTFTNNTKAINGCNFIINYSNFFNNQTGIYLQPAAGGYNYISNCVLNLNQTGIAGGAGGGASFFSLKNSTLDSNTVAGLAAGWYSNIDTVLNCEFKNNAIGILDSGTGGGGLRITQCVIENNTIGMKLKGSAYKQISCNKICNNTTWNLYYNVTFGNNFNMTNNYWCTTDSTIISSSIYDGYDNINLGLVDFNPVDMAQCYLTGCLLGVSANVTNATCDTCHNGTATAIVSNGFAPYTYTWYTAPLQTTQTATGMAPGTYTLCVTDGHGCTACNNSIFIDSTNCNGFSMYTNATNATCSACNDGTAWVTVSGGTAPYFYSWYTVPVQTTDTAINLMQGTYAVCVTDIYGCTVCDSVTVGTGNCSAHFNLYPDTAAHHYYAVNMASGVAPLTYDWNWGDSTAHDTTPFPDHTYAQAGFYTICLGITDSVGCTNTFCTNFYLQHNTNAMVYVNVIPFGQVGIQDSNIRNSFSIYPNPTHSSFTIKNTSLTVHSLIQILNPLGEIAYTESLSGKDEQVINPNLASGFYFVQVINEKGKMVGKLVVK